MTDTLGYRRKFAVLVPSTNTAVQPEFDAMRPAGVTNHISRIIIPNIPLESDEDFSRCMSLISAAQDAAIDSVMSCEPDHMVLGISSETFWDGLEASRQMKRDIAERTKLPVSMGSEACDEVLKLYKAKRIGVITPYWPVGDRRVKRYFEQAGYDVVRIKGLCCRSPMLIAHVTERELRDAMLAVDGDDVDAIVQCGTNLACARLAGEAETWLGKPVIAVNTAIYWHALRTAGIQDRIDGWGDLLSAH